MNGCNITRGTSQDKSIIAVLILEMVTSCIIHLRRLDGGKLSGLRNTDRKRVTFRSPAKKRGFSGCILE